MSHQILPQRNSPEARDSLYQDSIINGSQPYGSMRSRVLLETSLQSDKTQPIQSEEEKNRTSLHQDISSSTPDSLVSTIKDLRMELEEKNKEVRVLTVEMNNLEIRNSTYVAQLSFSKRINAAVSEKLQNLETLKNELIKKYQAKKAENIKLKEENLKLVEENHSLKRVLTLNTRQTEEDSFADENPHLPGIYRDSFDYPGASTALAFENDILNITGDASRENSREKAEIKSGRESLIEDLLLEKEKLSKRRNELHRYQDEQTRASFTKTPTRISSTSRRRVSEARISEERPRGTEQHQNYGYQVDPKAPMRIDDQMMDRKSPSRSGGDSGLKIKKEMLKYPKMKSASIKPRLPERINGEMISQQAADLSKRNVLSRQEAQENLSKGTKNIMRV